MGILQGSSVPLPQRPRLSGRLAAYAALDLVGMLVLVAGAVPLIDGMPLFPFPATTNQALICVVVGLALCAFAAVKIVREVLQQARHDVAGN